MKEFYKKHPKVFICLALYCAAQAFIIFDAIFHITPAQYPTRELKEDVSDLQKEFAQCDLQTQVGCNSHEYEDARKREREHSK